MTWFPNWLQRVNRLVGEAMQPFGRHLVRDEPELAQWLRGGRNVGQVYHWLLQEGIPKTERDRRRMQALRLGSTMVRQVVAPTFRGLSDHAYRSELLSWLTGTDWHRQAAAIYGLCSLDDEEGIAAILAGLDHDDLFLVFNRDAAFRALCLTDDRRCTFVFCRELEQDKTGALLAKAEIITWLANHGHTEATGAICKVLGRLTGANDGEQKQMASIGESLATLGSSEAVPSLWVACRNLKKIAASVEHQTAVRAALVSLAGDQLVKEWESEDNG